MKKRVRFTILLTIIFTLGSYITPSSFNSEINTVQAATPRKTVKEGFTTYTIYPINHYFTPSQVRTIVKNHNKQSSTPSAIIIKFSLGLAYPPLGFAFFAKELSDSGLMKPFISAERQGKVVRMKYDYWSSNVSNSVYKIKNHSIRVE